MSALLGQLETVQAQLVAEGLDGWLLYDFRGTNPFAARVVGLPAGALLTRRWWAYVPASGQPTVTAHAIERGSFPDVGLPVSSYSSRTDLAERLRATLGGARLVAMEYSPGGNIPYVSTVDGGTIDLVRSLGVEVASSGDLLQLFLAWSDEQIANHRRASQALTEDEGRRARVDPRAARRRCGARRVRAAEPSWSASCAAAGWTSTTPRSSASVSRATIRTTRPQPSGRGPSRRGRC